MQQNPQTIEQPKVPLFLQQHQTLSTTLGELLAYWVSQVPEGQNGFIPLAFADGDRPVTVLIAVGPESIEKVIKVMQP